MNNNSKLTKLINGINCSIILLFVMFTLSKSTVNINHAKLLSQETKNNFCNKPFEKELIYTFKVSDKLIGDGAIKLQFENNKITGIATGIGMTWQCNVDFQTNIAGKLDSSNSYINVLVSGTGDPIGIPIPGKINFHGPLIGHLKDKKLSLVGTVNIEGKLAHCAGFKNTEDLLIEIPADESLTKVLKEIRHENKLALHFN